MCLKRNKVLSAAFLLLSIFLFSCQDDDDHIVGTVDVALDKSTFVKELSITANSSWTVDKPANADWLEVLVKEKSLVVKAQPNMTRNVLKTKLTITERNGDKTVLNVAQEPSEADLAVIAMDSIAWLNYHQTEYEFTVLSKSAWTLQSDAPWVNMNVTNGGSGSTKVKVSFDPNTLSKNKREAVLKVITDAKTVEQKIIQRGMRTHDDATHYFYVHSTSLPVLYTGLEIMANEKPSWLIDTRGTLKPDKLPSYVTYLTYDKFPNNIVDAIRKIEKEDPDATYAYYADDLRAYVTIPIFSRLGIDTSRVKLTLLPDGAGSYTTMFSEFYGAAGTGGQKYREVESFVADSYARYTANPTLGWDDTKQDGVDHGSIETPHILSGYHNARYFIQDRDYLITHDSYVQEAITKNNYVVMPPRILLDNLSPQKQQAFYDLVGFDRQTNADLMSASPKPNLIILGTNTKVGVTSPEKQAACVQAVMDRYAGEYDIFYKAHPADDAYLTYETDFPGLKLIRPAAMPFDVFTWALNDQIDAIGGFSTTVFLTVPTDKVKFMFAKDASDLGGELFYDIFKDRNDIYWIDK